SLSRRLGLLVFIGSLALWLLYEIWAWRNGHPLEHADFWGIGHGRPVAQDFIVGFLFALSVVGFHAISRDLRAPDRWLVQAIKTAAGMTFALYLFHEPVTFFLRSLISWDPGNLASRALLICGSLAVIFLISLVTERQKESWRRAISALVNYVKP